MRKYKKIKEKHLIFAADGTVKFTVKYVIFPFVLNCKGDEYLTGSILLCIKGCNKVMTRILHYFSMCS